MKENNFLLVKKYSFRKFKNLDISKLDGFMFKPKNKKKYDGVKVDKLFMINPSFTETILKKKIRNRLEIYLRFIISIIESDDDDTDITSLRAALNDFTRYQSIVKNKYLKYLDDKYAAMLLQKMSLLEQELRNKIIYYSPKDIDDEYRRSR